jgi:DNA helicase II / ATP-dependent DNA helicase PcrA
MPVTIEISEVEISYAEKILLAHGKNFDKERIAFIKDFDTLDLQAAPGSGKTTALLAKLLILEKYLPLSSDRGILIVSHTNAAVDEIKEIIFLSKFYWHYPRFHRPILGYPILHKDYK